MIDAVRKKGKIYLDQKSSEIHQKHFSDQLISFKSKHAITD